MQQGGYVLAVRAERCLKLRLNVSVLRTQPRQQIHASEEAEAIHVDRSTSVYHHGHTWNTSSDYAGKQVRRSDIGPVIEAVKSSSYVQDYSVSFGQRPF